MLDVYRQAGVKIHILPPSAELPYQIFARDSSAMTPWGAVIMQLQKPYRRGEYAACLRFYLEAGIPIYDLVTAGNVEGGDFMVLKPGVAACGYSGERSIEPAVQPVAIMVPGGRLGVSHLRFRPAFPAPRRADGHVGRNLAVVCVEAVEPEFVTWLKARGIRVIPVPY